jgi:hypothetical protein
MALHWYMLVQGLKIEGAVRKTNIKKPAKMSSRIRSNRSSSSDRSASQHDVTEVSSRSKCPIILVDCDNLRELIHQYVLFFHTPGA